MCVCACMCIYIYIQATYAYLFACHIHVFKSSVVSGEHQYNTLFQAAFWAGRRMYASKSGKKHHQRSGSIAGAPSINVGMSWGN